MRIAISPYRLLRFIGLAPLLTIFVLAGCPQQECPAEPTVTPITPTVINDEPPRPAVNPCYEQVTILNQRLIEYERQNRDLLAQLEASRGSSSTQVQQLQATLRARDEQIRVLQDGMNQLRGNTKLNSKVQQQLEILLQRLRGTIVDNRLQLQSDFFFASGSYDLSPEGKAGLRELASILKSENVYLMIVGHTDSDPINASRSRGVRDNRHLSVLRSMSVLNELAAGGYDNRKMYPTGWGELYPVAPNDTPINKARNRRVEILIDPGMSDLMNLGQSAIIGIQQGF